MDDFLNKKIEPEDFAGFLGETLPSGAVIPLVVTGNSMRPFLYSGRDTVYLQAPNGSVSRGDIVFYKREPEKYILHRVKKITPDGFFAVGDAQTAVEGPIKQEKILAVVKKVKRKGKIIGEKSPVWFFYKRVWLSVYRIRPVIFSLYRKIKKHFMKKRAGAV